MFGGSQAAAASFSGLNVESSSSPVIPTEPTALFLAGVGHPYFTDMNSPILAQGLHEDWKVGVLSNPFTSWGGGSEVQRG